MPHFGLHQAMTEEIDGAGNPCGPCRAILLSDTGRLTQFGAFIEILPPGSRSSLPHWHAAVKVEDCLQDLRAVEASDAARTKFKA